MAEKLLYFTYGSNMNVVRFEDRVGPVENLGRAKLTGYRFAYNAGYHANETAGRYFANISESRMDSVVWGVLFRITPDQLWMLDEFEGYRSPSMYEGYTRKQLEIESDVIAYSGISKSAWTYIARPGYTWDQSSGSVHTHQYFPTRDYKYHCLAGALSNKLPVRYIRKYLIDSATEIGGATNV